MKSAVFIGRFQPFHIGHLSVVEKILKDYSRLLIVIGSAQESRTEKNPWTVEEREQIIRASIPLELQERIDIAGLEDVPDDDEWGMLLKKLIANFGEARKQKTENRKQSDTNALATTINHKRLTINDVVVFTGNDWVRGICERHGIQTEWIHYDIKISGTEIREKLRRGEDVSSFTCVNKI